MQENTYFIMWFPILGLHTLHQIEESIAFFPWYQAHAHEIPSWLLITDPQHADLVIAHPEYFLLASLGQIFLVGLIAYLFRYHEKITKILLFCYIAGLTFFLVWHILVSYITHSYAPILVTCILGLYLVPTWILKIIRLGR